MRSERGFTILEVAVTVAIIGVVAAMAIPIVTAARRNASVASTAWDLALYLKGPRAKALTEQKDLVFVLVDAQGNDARACGALSRARCVRRFLFAPLPTWSFATFDPASPSANVDETPGVIFEQDTLPRGIRFYLPAVDRTALPTPFDTVKVLDSGLTRACGPDGARCLALRFSADGQVTAEPPTSAPVTSAGVAIGLGSDLVAEHAGADLRSILVSFPSGIVRSYGLAP
jgi:prepilin-type N-terminal cleavage/methylation domain-containing protein